MLRAELSVANGALESYMTRCAALSKATDEAREKVQLHQGTIESLQRTTRELKARLAEAEQHNHDLQRQNSNLAGYIDRVREIDKLQLGITRARTGGAHVED